MDTSDATATAAMIRSGYTAYVKGQKITGTVPTQSGSTIYPGTATVTAVPSGRITTGNVYVAGDANLKAENIKSGVSIFGVAGTYSGTTGNTLVGSGTFVGNGSSSVSLSTSTTISVRPKLVIIYLTDLGTLPSGRYTTLWVAAEYGSNVAFASTYYWSAVNAPGLDTSTSSNSWSRASSYSVTVSSYFTFLSGHTYQYYMFM